MDKITYRLPLWTLEKRFVDSMDSWNSMEYTLAQPSTIRYMNGLKRDIGEFLTMAEGSELEANFKYLVSIAKAFDCGYDESSGRRLVLSLVP